MCRRPPYLSREAAVVSTIGEGAKGYLRDLARPRASIGDPMGLIRLHGEGGRSHMHTDDIVGLLGQGDARHARVLNHSPEDHCWELLLDIWERCRPLEEVQCLRGEHEHLLALVDVPCEWLVGVCSVGSVEGGEAMHVSQEGRVGDVVIIIIHDCVDGRPQIRLHRVVEVVPQIRSIDGPSPSSLALLRIATVRYS